MCVPISEAVSHNPSFSLLPFACSGFALWRELHRPRGWAASSQLAWAFGSQSAMHLYHRAASGRANRPQLHARGTGRPEGLLPQLHWGKFAPLFSAALRWYSSNLYICCRLSKGLTASNHQRWHSKCHFTPIPDPPNQHRGGQKPLSHSDAVFLWEQLF